MFTKTSINGIPRSMICQPVGARENVLTQMPFYLIGCYSSRDLALSRGFTRRGNMSTASLSALDEAFKSEVLCQYF